MRIKLTLPDWGDMLYYIDFDNKEKKVLISEGAFVGVYLDFNETVFKLCTYDSKNVDVVSRWCYSSFADAERAREVIQKDFDQHNIWNCDI